MPFDLVSIGLALVLGWWTTRLARNKGRKTAWIWGALAFVLTIPPAPWRLIGMVPLFILLFIRNPVPQADAPVRESRCGRCDAIRSSGQRYCIACGWELARTYPEAQATEPLAETAQANLEEPPVSAPNITPSQSAPFTEPDPTAPAAPEAAQPPEPALTSQTSEEPGAPEAAPDPKPVPETPALRGQPTAANMTERGIWYFNQGRIQESIDQFTKALALDAGFKEAWENRAEAYSRLGRGEQAAEDRRRLQAINAGLSSS